jgi:predicted nucleotidyltransferase
MPLREDTLWGQVIELPDEVGGGVRVVDRTNNLLENFFGSMKHGDRRRSGRNLLTQDFEVLPPAAALARNLTRAMERGVEVILLIEGSPVIKDLTRLASLELSPYRRVAERFAELAREIPEVRKVILFGSVAVGRAEAGSDTDVAVVLDRRSKRTMDMVYEIASDLQDETGVSIVPIAVLEKELESKKRLIRDLKRGDVLFERT